MHTETRVDQLQGFEQSCVHLASDMYIRHLQPFGKEKG